MNHQRPFRLWAFTSVLAMMLGSYACSSSSNDGGTMTARDAAPRDAGGAGDATPQDAPGPDARPMDATADAGPRPDAVPLDAMPGACSTSAPQEGCPCVPAAGADAGTLAQGNCADPANVCPNWERRAPVMGVPRPAVFTCVKTCTGEADCAGAGRMNTLCRGLTNVPAALGRVCVATETDVDQWCSVSRRPDGTGIHPLPHVGCKAPGQCLMALYTDEEPDEGFCVETCDGRSPMPNHGCNSPGRDYCNPAVLRAGTIDIGVCSARKIPMGGRCQYTGVVGFASHCDTSSTSSNLTCLRVPNSVGEGVSGYCYEGCMLTGPSTCRAQKIDGSQANCARVQLSGGTSIGLCNQGCSNFPDNCPGNGTTNDGNFCIALGTTGGDPFALCGDAVPPLLPEQPNVPMPPVPMAQNCLGPAMSPESRTNPFRCPGHTMCAGLDMVQPATNGACLRGCTTSTRTGTPPRGGCNTGQTCRNFNTARPLEGFCD